MRLSELFGSTSAEAALLLLSTLIPRASAVNYTAAPPPNLDFSKLGRVALTGEFDSISLYSYAGQNENGFSTNGSQALLSQLPNGAFATLDKSDATIRAMCPFVRKNGDLAGVVIGGNFTSIGGTAAQGIALWDPKSNDITPLPGLNGSVNAIYCNEDTDTVYVGGDFTGGNSTNAISWVGMTGWTNMPFKGFNGPVNAITKDPNGKILFAGSFTGLGNMTTPSGDDQQQINLGTATVTGGPQNAQAGFNDPKNVICQTSGQDGAGQTWLTANGGGGFWRADFSYGFQPAKLRLYNTHQGGAGTKTWRYTAFPINGIMNFTYTDPASGDIRSCSNECPLSNDPSVPFQDFHFVNKVGMNSFQIDISAIYGNNGGFNGIQLFEDDINAYAVNSQNEPSCGVAFPAKATTNGQWSTVSSTQSGSQYLRANLNGPGVNSNSAQVVFQPDIRQSGNYSVTIYTPGCSADNSCAKRGIANVTGIFSAGGKPVTRQIYQTNDNDKYDQIFHGLVDASSGSFTPTITLSPLSNQNDAISIVALRVRFQLMGAGSSGLNGLYEYNPNVAEVDNNFKKNEIDSAGNQLSDSAEVTTLEVIGKTTFIGGNFTNKNFANIFAMSEGKMGSLANGGLNNAVATGFVWNDLLYVGGNFTDTNQGSTKGLNRVAVYDPAKKSWSPLGAGVNGPVSSIVPLQLNVSGPPETCLTINGQFDRILASGSHSAVAVAGLAIWVPSRNEWIDNLGVQRQSILGQLSVSTNISGQTPLLAGTIQSQGWALSNAVALSTDDGEAYIAPIGLQASDSAAEAAKSLPKRDIVSQNFTGAVTGLFDTSNGRNMTVLAGHFSTTATDGSKLNNVALINSKDGKFTVTGFSDGIDTDSTFRAVARNDDTLYAGGQISGKVDDEDIHGLVIWDLANSKFASPQPPALDGGVFAISTRPDSDDLYIGGDFGSAGQIRCPALCVYKSGQWSRPGDNAQGVVNGMLWQGNDQLLVTGNLTLGNNKTYVGTYLASDSKQTWQTPDGASAVPGPVTALTAGSSDGSQYWIAGRSSKDDSAYLIKYDGTKFRTVPQVFGKNTDIRGISVVTLSDDHDDNDLLDNSYALMITGSINVPHFGSASAVLFNGTSLQPLILSNNGNDPGTLSQIISEIEQSFSASGGHIARGLVVLIALAVALGVMFLLVAAGLFVERRRKKAEGYRPAPQNYFEKTANMGRIPPEKLFGTLGTNGSGSPKAPV